MAKGNSNQKPPHCDCALKFNSARALGEHIAQTGHMEEKWCAECNHLCVRKEGLAQHKRDSPRHKNQQQHDTPTTAPPGPTKPIETRTSGITSMTSTKPDTNDGFVAITKGVAAKKLLMARKPATAGPGLATAESAKPKAPVLKKTVQATSNTQRIVLPTPMTTTPFPLSIGPLPSAGRYPWASGGQQPYALNLLVARCHTERVLKKQGYITRASGRNAYKPLPAATGAPKRRVIALDCEMVGLHGGRDGLARLSAVDFLTGEVLVDQLVAPTERVADWRTRWSGVTKAGMEAARQAGLALEGGWAAARAALSALADADTVLVGHSLNHDLRALRIAHARVVDSSVLYAEAVFGGGQRKGQRPQRMYGLKQLCAEVLGVDVQAAGRAGHDGLEDALATRELVIRFLARPADVRAWAGDARAVFEEQKRRREEKQRAQAEERARAKAAAEREEKPPANRDVDDDEDDGRISLDDFYYQKYLSAVATLELG